MSNFEAIFAKRLSLDSNSFTHRVLAAAEEQNTESKSTEKNIFRYSYNLGEQRTPRIHRTTSIGGNLTPPAMGEGWGKIHLGRKGLPRSFSLEAQIGRPVNANNNSCLTKQLTVHAQPDNEKIKETTINISVHQNNKEKAMSQEELSEWQSETNFKETAAKDKKSFKPIRGKLDHALSDSVPDLRSTGNLPLQREDFEGIFKSEIELVQSRPMCKLRRAERRLGVSLSSEDLYHKQRRNGLCNEIDDAAENRKLLRVLNKRF